MQIKAMAGDKRKKENISIIAGYGISDITGRFSQIYFLIPSKDWTKFNRRTSSNREKIT